MNKNALTNQGKLQDVILIRFFVVILLLFCHSFAIHTGSWELPPNTEIIPAYWWIGKGVASAMLETFVFISGYILGLQILKGKFKYNKSFIIKKFNRLIIPCIVFSILYIIFFYPYTKSSAIKLIRNISIAHMWFLPMLFWCFTSTLILKWFKVNIPLLLFLISVIYISIFSLPFHLSTFLKYAFYFYFGLYIFKNKKRILQKFCNWKSITIIGLLYNCIFIVAASLLLRNKDIAIRIIPNGIILMIAQITAKIIYSTLGIMFFYLTANKILQKIKTLPSWIINIADLSFAIYIIHQFILVAFFRCDFITSAMNQYLLPWCALIFTAILSIVTSKMLLKTKIGRKLLG